MKDPLWKWSVRAQIYLCYVIGFEVTRYRSRQEIKEKCDTWWKDSIRKERSVNDKQTFEGEREGGLKVGCVMCGAVCIPLLETEIISSA